MGHKTNASLCREIKVQQSNYGLWERLRAYPTNPHAIKKIEDYFHLSFDYLFPPDLRAAIDAGAGKWKRLSLIREIPVSELDQKEVSQLTWDGTREAFLNEERETVVMSVLNTLTEREREIIVYRFGLDGGTPATLGQAGWRFRVTRERVRQIEAKALRHLREPGRSKVLREVYEVSHRVSKRGRRRRRSPMKKAGSGIILGGVPSSEFGVKTRKCRHSPQGPALSYLEAKT